MIGSVGSIITFFLNSLSQVFTVATENWYLSALVALWAFDRMFGLFDVLRR